MKRQTYNDHMVDAMRYLYSTDTIKHEPLKIKKPIKERVLNVFWALVITAWFIVLGYALYVLIFPERLPLCPDVNWLQTCRVEPL